MLKNKINYIELRKDFARIRNGTTNYLENLIGEKEHYIFEHRLFNAVCLLISVSNLIRIIINLVTRIRISELNLISIFSTLCLLIIFYVSRYLKKLKLSKLLLFIIILLTFSLNWFYSGGSQGIVLFYYLWLFEIILFVYKKMYRIIFASVLLLNIIVLFFMEHSYPDLIYHLIDEPKLSLYKFHHFIIILVLTSLIIQIARALKPTNDTPDIAKLNLNHQNNHRRYINYNKVNNKLEKVDKCLTDQEKKVLELLISEKTNKEIASALFINLSTVKTHINNIYRKLGIKRRSNIMGFIRE